MVDTIITNWNESSQVEYDTFSFVSHSARNIYCRQLCSFFLFLVYFVLFRCVAFRGNNDLRLYKNPNQWLFNTLSVRFCFTFTFCFVAGNDVENYYYYYSFMIRPPLSFLLFVCSHSINQFCQSTTQYYQYFVLYCFVIRIHPSILLVK